MQCTPRQSVPSKKMSRLYSPMRRWVLFYSSSCSFLLLLLCVENSTIKEYYVFPFVYLFVQYVVWGEVREGGLSCFYRFLVVVFQSLLLTLETICFKILRTWKERLFHIVSFGILRRSKSKHFKLFLRKSAD